MDRRTVSGLLQLSDFNKPEFNGRFDEIISAGGIKEQETITEQDLAAYLFERYQRIEDEWIERNATSPHRDEEGATQTTEKMQHRARADAACIFQLLLENAPSEPMPAINAESTLTKRQFQKSLRTLATQIDYSTILPLAASMLLVGSSVGVISPIMPFVAEQLQMSSTHYGVVVSSFALSKMLGNVPSAILVERHGRKPYLVHSLGLVGLGVAGMGVAGDWMQLSACRMTVGLGVAALTTASTLTVADVSTPLSRASTFSPLMSAFAAGMALGPAVGGMLHDAYGIRDTFLMVATSYGVAAAWNHASVAETKKNGEWWEKDVLPWHDFPSSKRDAIITSTKDKSQPESSLAATISEALKDTAEQWSSLVADPKIRPVFVMNGFYMLSLSGTQFTLLPLILTGGGVATSTGTAAGLALAASAVGQLYAAMSVVQVLANPAAGRFADRVGKKPAIVVGGTLTSLAMASLPVIVSYYTGGATLSDVDWPLLAGTLGVWSLGGTLLATSHVAAISDAVDDSRRSQGIALLRTAGDVGYLCGAISAGLAADFAGDVGLAMQGGGAILFGSTLWFGLKTLALNRSDRSSKG
ncbi:hypothetical protein ACHAXT_005943 [Thalassiosira profunda]